jgi:CheY-like chemotaxis protein
VRTRAPNNGQATILVVEDDRLVRAGVRHVLEQLGYEVLVASGGADALRICEEHPGAIDLLLTDILMPGMTGGELAREVSARLPGVRRLYMSALPNEVLVEQGRIEAGEPSVMKPFSDEEIAGMVAKVLAS